eukprot:10059685-Alexandrium_andersonii.AAC.1
MGPWGLEPATPERARIPRAGAAVLHRMRGCSTQSQTRSLLAICQGPARTLGARPPRLLTARA